MVGACPELVVAISGGSQCPESEVRCSAFGGRSFSSDKRGKKEGLIVSYKVLLTEGHTAGDWNLILMTEVKDLATLEANEKKAEALGQRLIGDDQKQMQGYRDRAEIREVLGNRLAREIVLEPGR